MKLTHDQETVLATIAKHEIAKRFYWTGGTLLAHYYLHHRRSFDLDFFSDTAFAREELDPFIANIKEALDMKTLVERKIYDRWEFIVTDRDPALRFEFVHYNHEKKRLASLGVYRGIRIDSLADLAANKVMAYLDRNEPKDIFDVYVLLKKRKFTVERLLAMLKQKFGVSISEFTFWTESAKSFKKLDELIPYLLVTDPAKQEAVLKDLKYFFLDEGKDYLSKLLG